MNLFSKIKIKVKWTMLSSKVIMQLSMMQILHPKFLLNPMVANHGQKQLPPTVLAGILRQKRAGLRSLLTESKKAHSLQWQCCECKGKATCMSQDRLFYYLLGCPMKAKTL
jgi:hypothetical protein